MMKKIVFILISGLLLLILFSCKQDEDREPEKPTFPFMKVGNQWNYRMITEAGETEISYMIADKTKENYFKVLLNFVGSELPSVDHFWYADQEIFTMATEWPDSELKFTDVYKVRHTASSHPQFFADYFISLSSGIIKMEGMGYVRIDDDEIAYFPLEWQLKSKNF